VRTRRIDASPLPREYLVITNRMTNEFIPGNRRAFDVARTLRLTGGAPKTSGVGGGGVDKNGVVTKTTTTTPASVHFITYDGPYNKQFASQFDDLGIHYHTDIVVGGKKRGLATEKQTLRDEAARRTKRFDMVELLQKSDGAIVRSVTSCD
jgi:hypothetical protein